MDKAQLEKTLREFDADAEVEVDGDGAVEGFLITIRSTLFASKNEAQRQAEVWAHLSKRFSQRELGQVEFVFAVAPDDVAEDDPARGEPARE